MKIGDKVRVISTNCSANNMNNVEGVLTEIDVPNLGIPDNLPYQVDGFWVREVELIQPPKSEQVIKISYSQYKEAKKIVKAFKLQNK